MYCFTVYFLSKPYWALWVSRNSHQQKATGLARADCVHARQDAVDGVPPSGPAAGIIARYEDFRCDWPQCEAKHLDMSMHTAAACDFYSGYGHHRNSLQLALFILQAGIQHCR